MWVEAGMNSNIINDTDEAYWSESWIDKVKVIMKKRNMKFHESPKNEFEITSNKTIMEFAREYIKR